MTHRLFAVSWTSVFRWNPPQTVGWSIQTVGARVGPLAVRQGRCRAYYEYCSVESPQLTLPVLCKCSWRDIYRDHWTKPSYSAQWSVTITYPPSNPDGLSCFSWRLLAPWMDPAGCRPIVGSWLQTNGVRYYRTYFDSYSSLEDGVMCLAKGWSSTSKVTVGCRHTLDLTPTRIYPQVVTA